VAIGTPPDEENVNADGDYANYVPSHPYAQGGLSFSTGGAGASSGEAQQPSQNRQRGEFAGAHLSLAHPASVKVPPISEILARHKLSPHMAALHMPHPYAQARSQPGAPRDSYIDANGLVGQHRSDEGTPHTTKMWAQLSPGVVREILPGDLQYSPYLEERGGAGHSGSEGKEKDSSGNGAEVRDDDNDDGDAKDRRTLNIRDTVGVGETLVRASEVGHSLLPELGGVKRNAVQLFPSRSVDLGKSHQQPLEKLDISQIVEYTPKEKPTLEGNSSLQSNSFDISSSSTSRSPLLLGSPNDLETFKDLFYRPTNTRSMQRIPNEPALPETPSPPHHISNSAGGSNISWDIQRRTGSSSLTNLARQLTDEFEQMAMERERERTSSQYSNGNGSFLYEDQRVVPSGVSSRQQSRGSSISGGTGVGVGGLVRRPTAEGGSLEFVFEEVIPMSSSPTSDREGFGLELADPIHAFKPSDTLPEDVQSSRASSFIESSDGDDPTGKYLAFFPISTDLILTLVFLYSDAPSRDGRIGVDPSRSFVHAS
jgi:serine/arginine repetitive matrix protein 2